ncbi:MAG: LPS export ABC transporter periplasmic protein LptC [Acidobacteriia bacterium]|nr:LPS export ABC transporter periplasmic protein LptC [Terriglobia bacterium]
MPLPVYRLRRWLLAAAVVFTAVVGGMYFYARVRARNVLKEVPDKIGYDIKQTATGFQFSKSDGGRTLFTIQATDVKQFKFNGRAELHNVSIVLYGRDSTRFDQISGEDFAYDPKSGDVTANGEVQIDLEANPAGLTGPDQATPKELKNPIHLKTRDLVFNRETGNAWTNAKVEFRTPQATGSAVGVQYAGKANTLTLTSQIHVLLTGPDAAVIDATRAVVTNATRQIVVERPRVERGADTLRAEKATFFLGPDNNVERALAAGDVNAETQIEEAQRKAHPAKNSRATGRPLPALRSDPSGGGQSSKLHARADEGELLLAHNEPRTATLSGNVQLERVGAQPLQARAGRIILDFAGRKQLEKVRATDGVRLTQQADDRSAKPSGPASQNFELTAPTIDFLLAKGRVLDRAVTSGAAQITIFPAQNSDSNTPQAPRPRTAVTAGRFEAKFDQTSEDRSHLAAIHGAPDARIVSINPGQPDRVSTSQTVDAAFLPQGGIESITQAGGVAYTDNQSPEKRTQVWADRARYTPVDQTIVLSGNPRVTAGGMSTTAQTVRINRATGDALAEGDVKSTYSDLKEQPNGALLASASPIHVTARQMTARSSPGVALYTGNARLWQDANVIQAPSIQFDRERRSVTAQGTSSQPVSTILIQPEKKSAEPPPPAAKLTGRNQKSSPLAITGTQFTYTDAERKAHYEGGVVAKGADFTASAQTVDAYLLSRSQTSGTQSVAGLGQLDRVVAQGNVVIQQSKRRAEGQTLVYTAAEDKFVLTGGPPSIFDAERGKITGVSLTFYRRDDRVLVEGEASTPVVTQTRVAR